MTDPRAPHDGSRTTLRPAGIGTPPWEAHEQAIRIIRDTLAKLDTDRQAHRVPLLIDADMTPEHRANSVRFILSGPQDAGSVAAAGAQLVAWLAAMVRAEDASCTTGDEAA